MCKNHSHLIAEFVGENTEGPVPVLMFALANSTIQIQGSSPAGADLNLKTSGMLYVPSWMLGGWSLSPELLMAAPSMSLCFMPGGDPTIIAAVWEALQNSVPILRESSDGLAAYQVSKLVMPPANPGQ